MVSKKLSTMLGKLIEANVKTVTAAALASTFIDDFRENHNALPDYGIHMIRRLVESGLGPYHI
jgi:linoleate 10R-lipoxygenase